MDERVAGTPRNQQPHKIKQSTLFTVVGRSHFRGLPKELLHQIISTFREETQNPRDPTLVYFVIDIESLATLRLTCKILSEISTIYLFWSLPPDCERQLQHRVRTHGNIPQRIATHLRTLSMDLKGQLHLKSSVECSIAILSVARNVRSLRIGVPPSSPALPASFLRLCAAICSFTHLHSISFEAEFRLPLPNTSSHNYLHNVLLAQLLTRRGLPMTSISLEFAHISASNLSLLRAHRSRLKVLKFAHALTDEVVPILSLGRSWGFSDTLESLIISGISMKMVSVLLHCLARGQFGALKILNLHAPNRYEHDLGLPATMEWAIPPLHETILPLADTWFAIRIMQVVHTKTLILGPIPRSYPNTFDFLRFLQEVPSLNVKMVVADVYNQERTQVELLLHDRGIILLAPEKYW